LVQSDKKQKNTRKKRLRRGIYLLPSLLTLCAMMAGFFSIISVVRYHYTLSTVYVLHACWAIMLAMVLDGLDGRVARLTSTQSEFGAQLDSLSDLTNFGLAPALMMYFVSSVQMGDLGRLQWLICFLFAACAALRLARFNSQDENLNHHYFRGLSSPVAAGVLVFYVWFLAQNDALQNKWLVIIGLIMMVCVALLMVSKLKYHSFKDIDVRGRVPFYILLMVLVVFLMIIYFPALILLVLFSTYALSGVVAFFWLAYIRNWKIFKRK
jgi:CDP-diacylglycerol---serine O-phosphatidyltransferase